jgi:P4 family phage/plasmid primase-like protien
MTWGVEKFVFHRKNGVLQSFANTLRGLVQKKDAFKKRGAVVHLANGMMDLQKEIPRLMSYHPDYLSRNICPIAFDPEAECPRFINELLRSALDDEDIHLLQKWSGSVLLGHNPAQRLLLLIGTAGGGKSTLIEVIEKVIGEQNVAQLRTKHLDKQFELFKFLGKTLLTGKDVKADFLNEEGAEMIKALVGNDLLDAEKKYGNEHFQLCGNFNMAITCNSKLRVRLEGDAGAWQRRIMIIDYTRPKPAQRIAEFADKLIAAEGPGILNWMIEGAIQYLQDMDERSDFLLTEEQERRVDQLLAESDSVRQFVQSRVAPCEGADVTVLELQKAYFEYCEDQGWHALSNQDFRSGITDLMLEIYRVRKRNDIIRDCSKTHRGFSSVSIIGGR